MTISKTAGSFTPYHQKNSTYILISPQTRKIISTSVQAFFFSFFKAMHLQLWIMNYKYTS